MKGLILAGGKGTRLRPITHSIAKQLVPIANKPVIEFGIEALCDADVRDIGIVVGDSASEIERALGDGSRWGARFTYIPQSAPLGLAHAVKTAQNFLEENKFIVYLGDNLIKGGVLEFVREFESCNADASILLSRVSNPSEFGVAYLENDRVVRLEEKPKAPKSDYALVGVYLFTPCVFDAIDTLKPSFRGEYEITDAIQTLIDWGKEVRYHVVTGWWKDTGTVEAILEANRLILESKREKVDGEIIESKLEGIVVVEGGARIVRSSVRGPVVIGENAVIEESFIGPYSSIGKDVCISHSEIEYSIIMEGCCIENIATRLAGCLIGRGVRVARSDGKPKSLQLVLGDGSSVRLP